MMATISSALGNPYLVFAGWVLLVILWQTTAAAMLLAGWRSWRARATARETYRAATLAFVAAVSLAAVTPALLYVLPARSYEPPGVTGTTTEAMPTTPESQPSALPRAGSAGALLQQPVRPLSAVFADMLAAAAAIVWIAGVMVMLFRLAGGWLLAAAVRRQATTEDAGDALAAYARLKTELQIAPHVRLLRSHAVEGPVVIGWRRPALILPADASGRLSPEMIEALLAHELEHVKRRDYVLNLFQSVAEAVLFFSPPLLWISTRIREAREYCCDDAAVARCGNAVDYVKALTMLASLGTLNTTRPAMGAAGPRLITRVRRLLQGEAMPKFRMLKIAASAALLVVVGVTGVRVAAASSERAPRIGTGSPAATRAQEAVPFGYATEQEGSGVVLSGFVSTAQAPAERVTIANVTNRRVVGVRFVAGLERWRRGGAREPIRLFVSERIPVSIGPGEKADVAPAVLTAQQLDGIWAEAPELRMQLFFGLSEVVYENGFEWRITPNPSATTGSEALSMPKPLASRELIARDGARVEVEHAACRDEQGRATSHGGVMNIRNEPGARVRCQNGRWIEVRK